MIENKIRFIGDIHAQVHKYQNIIQGVDYSIQLGDFGFGYEWNELKVKHIDGNKHKIIAGNHDDYNFIKNEKPLANLGDYGTYNLNGLDFFYVRGADSIDKDMRIEGKDWWVDEELSYAELNKAIDLYEQVKPEVMLTHAFPETLLQVLFPSKYALYPSITGQALSSMFDIHKPKLWVFGHMHPFLNEVHNILGTTFMCLSEFGTFDYDTSQPVEMNVHMANVLNIGYK